MGLAEVGIEYVFVFTYIEDTLITVTSMSALK